MNAIYATVQALLADSSITAIVGQRVEIEEAPEGGTLPDIIVQPMTNPDVLLLAGRGQYPDARFRIHARARTKTEAINLGDLIIARLGTYIGGEHAGMVGTWTQAETDEMDSAVDFSVHRRMIDFRCRYCSAP